MHCPLQTPAFQRMLSCGPQRREKALFKGHKRGPSAAQGHGQRWGQRGTGLPKTLSRQLGSPRLPRKGRGRGVVLHAAGGATRMRAHTTHVLSQGVGCAHSTWGGCGQAEARERTGVSSEMSVWARGVRRFKRGCIQACGCVLDRASGTTWALAVSRWARQQRPRNTSGQGREPPHGPPERQSRPPAHVTCC